MGYKYGVWLTYKKSLIPTTHIGHFTVACYMTKRDALCLHEDILAKYGNTHYIDVNGKKPVLFDKNVYKDDNNELNEWGYEGTCKKWTEFKKCTQEYNCNFSEIPHTTVEYYKNRETNTFAMDNMCVQCNLVVANINSNDPKKWSILKK